MTFAPVNSKSAFLPTSEVYPQDPGQLLIKLTGLHTDIANAVNVREISIYQDSQEVMTGQLYSIPNDSQHKRYVFRKMFYFGAIAAGAALNIPHGLTGVTFYTNMYGTVVTTVPDYRPLPFASTAAVGNQISLRVAGANIVITNGGTASPITSGQVVLEYVYT
jgi:hypothetical protein